MNLIKVNTAPSVFNQMNGILDNFFSDQGSNYNYWTPNYEVLNNEKEYTILMEVPGIEKNKLVIECLDQKLSISGNRETKVDSSESLNSSQYGEFKKEFAMPDDVIGKDVNAKLRNGVLEIVLPRQAEIKSKAQKITIK